MLERGVTAVPILVTPTETTRVVIGPPGCGKTHHLAESVLECVTRFGSGSVMVASLTRAAAQEAVDRVSGRLAKSARVIPRDSVATLHSHARRALGSPDIAEAAAPLKDWSQRYPRWKLGTQARAEGPEGSGGGQALLEAWNVRRARLKSAPTAGPLARFVEAWEAWKAEGNLLDFEDLIHHAYERTEQAPGAPRVIYGDEAQDWSLSELRLVLKWAAKARGLVLVGDPDQSLYDWRGADSGAFLGLVESVPPESRRILSQSYRVPEAVHKVAVQWARAKISRRVGAEYSPRDERGRARTLDATHKNPGLLVADVERVIGSGRSVMVLATAGHFLARTLKDFRGRGVPYANRYRVEEGKWNPLGRSRLLRFLSISSDHYGDAARPWTWSDVGSWAGILEASTFKRGGKARIAGEAKDRPEDEADLGAVFSLLDCDFELEPRWLLERALPTRKDPLRYQVRVVERFGLDALGEPPVTVGTVHSVKGGEADVVYVLPDVTPKAGDAMGTREGLDALGRLGYVALTRAREELVRCAAASSRGLSLW